MVDGPTGDWAHLLTVPSPVPGVGAPGGRRMQELQLRAVDVAGASIVARLRCSVTTSAAGSEFR